jgi:hypothetical protein
MFAVTKKRTNFSFLGNLMTTPLAYNLPTHDSMSMIEEKDDSMMVEASLIGSIDTR